MKIQEILNKSKQKSNFEEFANFLFNQDIPYQFRAINYLPVNYKKIEEKVSLNQIIDKELYFLLEYENKPILIYNIDEEKSIVKNIFCLNKEEFKNLLIYFSNNLDTSNIPMIKKE